MQQSYCGKNERHDQKFDPAIHKDSNFGEYLKKVNDDYVVRLCHDCRMGFGELLKFENELG